MSDGFKLNPKGEKEVTSIIANMKDEKADEGFKYWDRSMSAPSKKTRFGKDGLSKIKAWAQEEVNTGSLNIRDIKTGRDYAMLALWIITVHLKKENAVRWNDAYYYFKEKYTTISATTNGFRKALTKPVNEKYFAKTGELFYLTPEGDKVVEAWIAGKPVNTSREEES